MQYLDIFDTSKKGITFVIDCLFRTFCFAARGDADEGDNDDDTGDEISVNFE